MVSLVSLVQVDSLAYQDLVASVVSLVRLALAGSLVSVDSPAYLVLVVILAYLDFLVYQDILVRVYQVLVDFRAHQDFLV